jgi:hypothetical protein
MQRHNEIRRKSGRGARRTATFHLGSRSQLKQLLGFDFPRPHAIVRPVFFLGGVSQFKVQHDLRYHCQLQSSILTIAARKNSRFHSDPSYGSFVLMTPIRLYYKAIVLGSLRKQRLEADLVHGAPLYFIWQNEEEI